MLLIDFPLFTASTFSIAVFYLMSERELFPKTWKGLFTICISHGFGHCLTVTNTKAVMEALFGIKSAFVRTLSTGLPRRARSRSREVPQAAGPGPVDRAAAWHLLLPGDSLYILEPELLYCSVFDFVRHRLLVHGVDELAAGAV